MVVTLQSRLLADLVVQRLNLGWQITAVSPQLKVTIGEFAVTGALTGLQIKMTGPKSFAVYDGSGRFVGEGESGKPLSVEGVRLLLNIESAQAGQSLMVDRQPVAAAHRQACCRSAGRAPAGRRQAPQDQSCGARTRNIFAMRSTC